MGIYEFFSSIADIYRNHYLELADNPAIQRRLPRLTTTSDEPAEPAPARTDTYEPSPDTAPEPTATEVPDSTLDDVSDPVKTTDNLPAADDSDEPAEEPVDEQSYRHRNHTHFNYEVRLEFQLQAIAQMAQEIADGETVSSQELAAAGFGLKAAMDFSGIRLEESRGGEVTPAEGKNGASLLKARNAMAFAAQSRNFALESFSSESLKVKRTLNANSSEHYQRAVSKFSLRFRLDTQFSFAYLNVFNAQTQRMAEVEPGSVGSYADTAGNVAEKGTSEMMAAFFDAVEAYLDQAEELLLSRAGEFIDMASTELGLSEEALAAREHLLGTIESFFRQVDEAVEFLESTFVSPSPEPLLAETGIPPADAIDKYAPSVKEQTKQLALA